MGKLYLYFFSLLAALAAGQRSIVMSVSVCLYVREHISETTRCLCVLSITAAARSSSGGAAIRRVLPVLWTMYNLRMMSAVYADAVAASDVTASSCAG